VNPQTEARQLTVSVVIPAYNAAVTVERALDSVHAQTCPGIIEVIVVDDGSTDDTSALIREKYPQVTLIRQDNTGNAGARNRGIDEARGDYVAFLDADDEWLPEHLAVLAAAAGWLARADLLMCQEAYPQPDGSISRPRMQEGLHTLDFRYWLGHERFALGFSYCCSGWMVSREALKRVGGFSASVLQCVDVEFLLRFTSLGFAVAGVTHPGYKRFIQKQSVSRGIEASVRGPITYCGLIRTYAPDASQPSGRVLSRLEYEGFLKQALLVAAQALIAAGRAQEARELFMEARGLRGGSLQVRVGSVLGALAPRALSWFYRRVWLRLRGMEAAVRLARGYVRTGRKG